jgi:hypothetical protein
MASFDDFPIVGDLEAKNESRAFHGSNDISRSTVINGMDLMVRRPNDNEMYGVFFGEEEVAMIGGSTEEAERVFDRTAELLKSGMATEEAKQKIRDFIVEIHGGTQN